jgi:hypothetical protein
MPGWTAVFRISLNCPMSIWIRMVGVHVGSLGKDVLQAGPEPFIEGDIQTFNY